MTKNVAKISIILSFWTVLKKKNCFIVEQKIKLSSYLKLAKLYKQNVARLLRKAKSELNCS